MAKPRICNERIFEENLGGRECDKVEEWDIGDCNERIFEENLGGRECDKVEEWDIGDCNERIFFDNLGGSFINIPQLKKSLLYNFHHLL